MRRSHNTSDRLIQCLHDAGIDPNFLANYLTHCLDNCPAPKPMNSRENFEYGLSVIQSRRLILLIAP